MIQIVFGVLVLLWIVYKWWNSNYNYWKSRGFPYVPSTWPLGNLSELVLLNGYQGTAVKKLYDEVKNQPYVGVVLGRRPHLFVNSPSIIKNIMLKDFNYFTDRINVDSISKQKTSRHLFNSGGDEWRAFRTKMTPIFTSGKMKLMFSLFHRCANQLEEAISLEKSSVVDVKWYMSRFTTDVISSCAFGLEANSLISSDSQIHDIALKMFPTKGDLKGKLSLIINAMLPGIENYYRPTLLDDAIESFLVHLVPETIQRREASNIKRNDLIDLLIEMKKAGKISVDKSQAKEIEISDDNLVGQVFVFLAAGFETSSSVSTYCLYEMAMNPEIQDKLRSEIHDVIKDHGSFTYQSVMDMPYLDQIISETMRKYPTVPVLTRKCTTNYKMPGRPDLVLEKGIRVLIPVYALHHDPEYFPDPDKFDPERFSSENKRQIVPFSYLPFGEGPRICIGMRFGLLQTKMAVASVINKFRVIPASTTPDRLEFGGSRIVTILEDPLYLKLEHLD